MAKRHAKPLAKKFYFTAAADLALLKEMLNVRPFAAEHGQKNDKNMVVTSNLNQHLGTTLSVRTVKERFALLVEDFQKSDAQYRRKSGVAEDYVEQQQLLQDIICQIKDARDAKEAKKGDKKAKADRLESYGEVLREQGRKRQCRRLSDEGIAQKNGDPSVHAVVDDSSSGLNADTTSGDACDKQPELRKATERAGGRPTRVSSLSNAQVNAAIAEFLDERARSRDDVNAQYDRELRFKKAKANREAARWEREHDLRMEEARATAQRWAEEAQLRREEMQLRREELELMRRQADLLMKRDAKQEESDR
ncbi:hypothetical protein ATCC90586_011254 [Pythium insidiosum]|nr:hypothetical protein ATCC90586_011254 [Pythium insidiosum]